ncbi:hypothetical protein [Mycolicibacterium iranicum]|uniref:Uncharacterized protein n=1 Tax=Mycolicibacterium iranicum TaxID=912594 RepID=A0ABT4HRA6_MYCIR|nr:hypothetical protein [Mycolicibacterium iranicum]MCZ0732570.1 hypothetical protein [Mycolicibacterium iranicum]
MQDRGTFTHGPEWPWPTGEIPDSKPSGTVKSRDVVYDVVV